MFKRQRDHYGDPVVTITVDMLRSIATARAGTWTVSSEGPPPVVVPPVEFPPLVVPPPPEFPLLLVVVLLVVVVTPLVLVELDIELDETSVQSLQPLSPRIPAAPAVTMSS
jgi:hypothetical protein